jgi:hypothetical protein
VKPCSFALARSLVGVLLLAPLAAGCARVPTPGATAAAERGPEFGEAFWNRWGDGRGELAGYELDTPRYGALRHGTAVTIFVTETFSNARRVKADPGRHPKRDEFPVMKLNLVQDFPTGIYDYNLLTSAFTALGPVNARPPGSPTKVSFSAQEWCGHVYAQVLFDARYARFTSHSYFDTEADSTGAMEIPNDVLSEDALLAWARGFSAPLLAPGDSAEAPVLGSLRQSRLLHQPLVVSQARFKRAATPESVVVPAGSFEADVYTVAITAGRTWTFWIEASEPRRVLMWSCSDGERARLLRSDRLAYWNLNAPGGEHYLKALGLTPRPPRTP